MVSRAAPRSTPDREELSNVMKKTQSKKASSSSTQIEESIKLFGQAKAAIGTVQRLLPLERMRTAKIRRGGRAVVPMIAAVAKNYGIVAPTLDGDALNAKLSNVQSLDPLLNAASEAHETIADAHFNASNDLWTSARTLYGQLKKVAETNASVATELKPVTEWFRQQRSAKAAPAAASTTPTTAPANASAPAPAAAPAAASPANASASAVAPAVVAPTGH